MEEDMEVLLKLLDENEQTVEEFLNIKLPLFFSIYFKIRNFMKFIMQCVGILFLVVFLIIFTFVLSLFLLEFTNLFPINKSLDFIYQTAYNGIEILYSDNNIESRRCLIDNVYKEFLRPPANCNFCHNVNQIKKVSNLSQNEFKDVYAYSGRPVIIKDATNNWTARKLFSFEFFQTIYAHSLFVKTNKFSNYSSLFNRKSLTFDEKISILLDNELDNLLTCQFFKYETDYGSLEEFLARNIDNSNQSNPWYVGWSNCNPSVSKILRQHYSLPYFLPENSEPHNSDWIFMGYPGYGAKMHIDFVVRPSWQAQLKGQKLWRLKPPHECRFACPQNIKAIVEAGEIIVLDTNLWYHQTEIIGDDVSVTVGAEYD